MLTTKQVEMKAKLILEVICNYPIGLLSLSDMPDLQDDKNSYGIEVVEDCIANEKEKQFLVEEMWENHISDIPDKRISRFEKLGGELQIKNGIVSGATISRSKNKFDNLLSTIEAKYQKLNSGKYKTFKRYGLYVIIQSVIMFSSNVPFIIEQVVKKDYPTKYDVLYLDNNYEMYVCDMIKQKYKKYEISNETNKQIYEELKHGKINS